MQKFYLVLLHVLVAVASATCLPIPASNPETGPLFNGLPEPPWVPVQASAEDPPAYYSADFYWNAWSSNSNVPLAGNYYMIVVPYNSWANPDGSASFSLMSNVSDGYPCCEITTSDPQQIAILTASFQWQIVIEVGTVVQWLSQDADSHWFWGCNAAGNLGWYFTAQMVGTTVYTVPQWLGLDEVD